MRRVLWLVLFVACGQRGPQPGAARTGEPPPRDAGADHAAVTDAASERTSEPAPDARIDVAGTGSPADFVDVTAAIPDAVLDIRYATDNNFTKRTLYPVARCKLRRSVAVRLAQAADRLRAQDRRLLLWDCYRPRSIQAELWKLVPDERYVANPKQGSRHNRGAAVDVGLVDIAGQPVVLPTAFDDFSAAAHRDKALTGPRGAEARRLEQAMTQAGFVGLPTEWWHFDAPDASSYPLADEPL